MRTGSELLKRIVSPSSSRPKWHLVYFVQAGFVLVTIFISLYVNHRLVGAYSETVAANEEWAERLSRYGALGELADAANAAGNDVFETRDVEAESDRLRESLGQFNEVLGTARDDLKENVAGEEAARLLGRLEEVADAMQAQVAEAQALFTLFAAGDSARAAERMARMDRHHARLNLTLARLRQEVARIQSLDFRRQHASASLLRTVEYVIATLILLIVAAVTVYGYKLAQQVAAATRAIEQQREREALRAKQAASVAQLATGVAHELRNPLTSVKMLVQSNREEAAARGMPSEDLAVIEQEIRRMERYLQTFLDFARPPKPERRPLDLSELVDRTCALIEGRAAKQQVTLRYLPPGPAVMVEADSDQIQQLLLNLSLNALDAMPRGGTLHFDLRVPLDDRVELRVLDSGPGIQPQVLAQVFEPFVTTKETGVGLGLVVSRRIAEDHGGSLIASNRPEGGACFLLRLPALDSSARAVRSRSQAIA
jgi:signal transduction histidine kinase